MFIAIDNSEKNKIDEAYNHLKIPRIGRAMCCRLIENLVATSFHVPVKKIRASTRCQARIAFCRQVSMYLAHVVLGMSLSEVGRLFKRDRTTVAHACHIVEDKRDEEVFDNVIISLEYAISAEIMHGNITRCMSGGLLNERA